MNLKTALLIFLIGFFISCASNSDKLTESDDNITFPDSGKGCCE